MYDEYFGPDQSLMEELEDEEPAQGVVFGEPIEGADPGVEVEATMPSDQLAANLGFQEGHTPFLFNSVRHTAGISAWSPEFEEACRSSCDSIEPFSLQWHQLAGVHAAIRKVFSPTPDVNHCSGILFADDVGLGKTIQSATIMAFLSEVSILQQRELAVPPIARE